MDIPVAANVLGTMGAVCWSIQLIPQIVINHRRHHAIGLQPSMMMLWAWAGVPLGVYNIVQDFNVALRIQPQILTLLSLVTWIQCYYYEKHASSTPRLTERGFVTTKKKWSVLRSLAVVVPVALLMGGIQAALIVALRVAQHRSTDWPLTLMAVLSATLLAAGVLTHYWDIWLHRTVRGISFIFVGIDALGDVFSLVSVFFQPKLDVLGMVIYGTELALWLGVFACGGHYNLVPWARSKWWPSEEQTTPSFGEGGDLQREGHSRGSEGFALQESPSSTSVFRTVSGEGAGSLRSRTARVGGGAE